jgi:hypothetical protein
MTTHRRLSETHQQTLLQIFQHKPAAIEWADLVHLVEEVGEIVPKGDDTYRLVVNGEGHVLARPHHDKITDPGDLAAIKTLFERGRVRP